MHLNPLGIQPQNPLTEGQEQTINNKPVIMYLKEKCHNRLSDVEIERKLLMGENFQIPGCGNNIDNQLIESVLRENDFYEKETQKQMKETALRFVKGVIEEWSIEIAKNEKKINKNQLPNYTAKVLAFGSQVLDLRSNSSDIDLICVVPNFINRQIHFFEGLAQKLETNSQVKNLSVRRQAQVPIITFFFKEINIDISFCKLETETVPREIERFISIDLLNSIKDEKSKVSLLGRKNNLMILELAGPTQEQNFKTALRLIKVWAKNRGIHANGMGFLGGISWAILMAKICQIFPYHKPISLLKQFFCLYRLWKWKQMPVHLIHQQEAKEYATQKQTMSIFTPGSAKNSTERINEITYDTISNELERGYQILGFQKDVEYLCQKVDFINQFPLFIEIDICGKNLGKEQEKDYQDWQGSIEAKVLVLLSNILKYNKKQIESKKLTVVPNPKVYLKNDQDYDFCNSMFIGIKITQSLDLNKAVVEWCNHLKQKRKGDHLNVRIFECKKQDFLGDVEIVQAKKKQEKEDPRLALRANRRGN